MKSLKPSMREKKRYLLIKGNNLKINVDKSILEFIGILGMSKSCPNWIKLDKNSGILAVNRKALNHVKASFAAYSEKIIVEKISGTLKGLGK